MKFSLQSRTAFIVVVVCAAVVGGFLFRSLAAETQTNSGEVKLSEEKQKIIWDAEHIAFLIETYFGKPLMAELRTGNSDLLNSKLLNGFAGNLIDQTKSESTVASQVTEEKFETASESKAIDADEFCAAIVKKIEIFKDVNEAGLRALHVTGLDGENRWRCRLMLSFSGIGKDGRARETVSEHEVEFVVPSKDKFKDALISKAVIHEWTEKKEVLRISKMPQLMSEITKVTGLDRMPLPDNWRISPEFEQYWFQVGVEDFDRDGVNDIAVATAEGRILLLRTDRGAPFTDVSKVLGIPNSIEPRVNKTFLLSWIDFDNDGFPDLVAGDRLYHNESGRRFTDVTESSGILIPFLAMGATVADFNADGLADIYIYNQSTFSEAHSSAPKGWVGDHQNGAENQLWKNLGDGRFQNVAVEAGATGGKRKTFAASAFFFDDDVFPDLYIANDFGENMLLKNRGDGTFEDVTEQTGTGDFATSMGVTTGDLNNDGKAEIYVANMYSKMGRRIIANIGEEDYPPGIFHQIKGSCAGNRLYTLGKGEKRYRELGEATHVNGVGWAYAPAMTDLNGDGLLDLYATTGFLSRDRRKPDG